MEIQIVEKPISRDILTTIAEAQFFDFVKAVVDTQKEIMAIGGELHADTEAVLISAGSRQQDLWGINLYIAKPHPEWIAFDSMINIRPSQNNRSRDVEDPQIREAITRVVKKLII